MIFYGGSLLSFFLFCLFSLIFRRNVFFFLDTKKTTTTNKRANCFTSHHMGQLLTKLLGGSSSLTEAEIDKLTASKLRKLLDAKGIAHEKKEVKAALAAKLKDAMRKEKEEEDSDEEDFDEYEDDGSVEWIMRMHQKIARPKNKRDWEIRESVLSGGGIP